MRNHQHEDPAGDREDRSEHQPDDRGLLDAGESLLEVVRQSKQSRGQQHDQCLGSRAGSEELAQALEQESAEQRFFAEARADDDRVEHSR